MIANNVPRKHTHNQLSVVEHFQRWLIKSAKSKWPPKEQCNYKNNHNAFFYKWKSSLSILTFLCVHYAAEVCSSPLGHHVEGSLLNPYARVRTNHVFHTSDLLLPSHHHDAVGRNRSIDGRRKEEHLPGPQIA